MSGGNGTARTPLRVRAAVGALAVLLLVSTAACSTVPGPAPEKLDTVPFPRTAGVYLAHDAPPDVTELARHDVVVIDMEWAHRTPRVFADLRHLNPRIRILAYVALADMPDQLGSERDWALRYRLYRFTGPRTRTFPAGWSARSADGSIVSEWPQTTMTNVTDRAPQVESVRYNQHAADWVVRDVWPSARWDGIFLDSWQDRAWGASRSSWDVDGDGVDDPAVFGADSDWERGLTTTERLIRHDLPDAVLVANGARTFRDGLLDGRMWEHFGDPTHGRQMPYDLQNYVTSTSGPGHREPGVALTADRRPRGGPLTADDVRRARFFLTATLMQNGYWAAADTDYDGLVRFDETDGGGLGPGYLGQAVRPDPNWADVSRPYRDGVGSVAPGVYRRDFDNGIALVNVGATAQVVDLGGSFRHLRGTQDPAVNNGSTVTSVTVPPSDGVVLLRN